VTNKMWPEKFIIGLTGNIATGKSVVRKMLEHVGAFGIDADALSNRVIQKGAPGYLPVLETFGHFILDEAGNIDRAKLGRIVFSDAEALRKLEEIIHPHVRNAVQLLIQRSGARVVVIEAIKLLDSPLLEDCDVIWVTTSDQDIQLARLAEKRGMPEDQAQARMAAQSTQEEKVAKADTVIHNNGTITSTWEQVKAAWKLQFPETDGDTVALNINSDLDTRPSRVEKSAWTLTRARPRQAGQIAEFVRKHGGFWQPDEEEILAAFAERAFLLLQNELGIRALVGWRVENLIARIEEIVCASDEDQGEMLAYLTQEVEEASSELQCEVLLIILAANAAYDPVFTLMGYEKRSPNSLNVPAWKEAALESFEDNQVMYFKSLRGDRILKPL